MSNGGPLIVCKQRKQQNLCGQTNRKTRQTPGKSDKTKGSADGKHHKSPKISLCYCSKAELISGWQFWPGFAVARLLTLSAT